MVREITQEEFNRILPLICSAETSADPDGWIPENPLWGHCAVVSLVAQNFFGGGLLRASLKETPFAAGGSHYWNKLSGGTEIDFTASQFGSQYPVNLVSETRERTYVLSNVKTKLRYQLLALRVVKALSGNNSIFDDTMYQKCFFAALDSECQKMRFGCVITHNGEVVYEGCNSVLEPLRLFCEPRCIRFSITSRTESMIGACGHAEEGIWEVKKKGIPLEECELYIAGFYPNHLPWLKTKAEHTCLRCAVQMYYANLKTIYVPVREVKMNNSDVELWERTSWKGMTAKRALETAREYAEKILKTT